MKLLLPVGLNILLVVAFYLAENRTKFKELSFMKKQIIIGVVFGGLSCFASSFGFDVFGTVANVRDAAPLSAGLIFGAPAGIISGVIGGLYRFFSVYWGGGEETRIACTIATVLAGLMAAALRKFMFDDKKPTWSYAIVITIFCEVVHMLLIFITNMKNSVRAFELVKSFFLPMIVGNVIAVGCALVAVALLSKEGFRRKKQNEQIAETFQKWLLACIVVAFLGTSAFTYILQNGMSQIDTREVFTSAINDVETDVREKSDAYLISILKNVRKEYEDNPKYKQNLTDDLILLAQEFEIDEINIVRSVGIIIGSTESDSIGYDMNVADQSKEFVDKLKTQSEFVQPYSPRGKDQNVWRKYAAVNLSDGGFIQVGYGADRFHEMLNEFVIDVTKNRHVGTNGFVAVCDDKLNLVIDDIKYSGKPITTIGIQPQEEMEQRKTATQLYKDDIVDAETQQSAKYIYVFKFVEGYCIIAAMPESEAMFMRDASLYTSIFMQVLVFATLFVFIYILIKRVIINNLKKINNSLAQITDGNLNVMVDVRSNKEFASLSDDINSTVTTLKRYIAEAAARIDKELEYAKQIQLSALPTNFPDNDDYGIYAQMIAAKEVGGDFYDFYKLGDDKIAFLVADVSGKGIPAAMFMMTAKTIIKDLAESGMSVNDIFTRANEKLCENNESGMFVTAWMGILDIKTGLLQFANAGHNPPLIKRADGSFEYLKARTGFVLAGMEGIRYRANELTLAPGDRIFLYTDGVPEATNVDNKLYGEQRLLEFINQNVTTKATELLPALKASIDEFVGQAPQFDDITMLMFDYKPNSQMVQLNKTFPAEEEQLSSVLDFVEETLSSVDCSLKLQTAICVAIEEVFVNVAHYAYGDGSGAVDFKITFDPTSRLVTFQMADKGIPFDPLAKPDPDITLTAEERQIGGLGIFITKKTMDTVSYAYENGQNILTMIKKI